MNGSMGLDAFFANSATVPLATSMNMPLLLAVISFLNVFIFWPLYRFVDRTASEMIGNRMREGDVMQQRAPGQDSNLGLLH